MDYQQNQYGYGQQAPQQQPAANQASSYGFDDEIDEGQENIILPDNIYKFQVFKMERGEYEGSSKMPACKTVDLTLLVNYQGETVFVNKRFFLTSNNTNQIFRFFLSIGDQPGPNGKIRMNWPGCIGKTGYYESKQRPSKNDPNVKFNDVKKFLKPGEVTPQPSQPTQPQSQGWQGGRF